MTEVGKLVQIRGMGILIAARVQVTIHIRVAIIIGFVFDVFPFGIHNEFSQYPYALGSVVIDVIFEIDIIIIISFMLALVEPTGNLRVLLEAGLRIGIEFDIANNNTELEFDPEFRHIVNNNGFAPDGNLSPCGGNFILASDQGETSFIDNFGGYRSFYLPKVANQQCCLTWNFDMELTRFRPGETPEIIEDSFSVDYCFDEVPSNPNQYRIYVTSSPAPTGVPETLEMDLSDTAQLFVMAEPVDVNGNPTGPAVNIKDLDYGVEFFLDNETLDVLDPTTLPEGDAFAVQTGDNTIKAAVTSVEILDDEEVIAFYPDSISGFSIMTFLARGEAPRVEPEGLPVSVETVAAHNITVTPKLVYKEDNNIVDAESVLLRNEPNESQRHYFFAVEFEGIDVNTPDQIITFVANFDSQSGSNLPKLTITNEVNGTSVDVEKAPLYIDSLLTWKEDRHLKKLATEFFQGTMMQQNQVIKYSITNTTPNNQLLVIPVNKNNPEMNIKPNNKETVDSSGNITGFVPPGYQFGNRQVKIKIAMKVTTDDDDTYILSNTQILNYEVKNEETFEEYLRVFHTSQSIVQKDILLGTELENFTEGFQNAISILSGQPEFSELRHKGITLWNASVALVKEGVATPTTTNLPKIDDRVLYYIRLSCTAWLRNHFIRRGFGSLPKDLLNAFEYSSRGLEVTTGSDPRIPFTPSNRRKVIVTGFDPFVLPSDPERSNSSGIAALGLRGEQIEINNQGKYEIQTAIIPVRYADFDDNLIEDITKNSIVPIKMFMSTSLNFSFGRTNYYDVERFVSQRRSLAGRDNNYDKSDDQYPVDGEFYLESSLPHEGVITDDDANTQSLPGPQGNDMPFVLDQSFLILNAGVLPSGTNVSGKIQLSSIRGTLDAWKKVNPPIPQRPLEYGSPGSFLSNEIIYRICVVRDVEKPELSAGHLHLPIAVPESEGSLRLIEGVELATQKFMKNLYLLQMPIGISFLNTIINSTRTIDVVITNPIGNGQISISQILTEEPFSVVHPTLPFSIGEGQSETVQFKFEPTSIGFFEKTVTFKDGNGQIVGCPNVIGRGVAILPIPVITGFSPDQGPPFTLVTVTGSNFINVERVLIGGEEAFYQINNPGEIIILPHQTGKIKIETAYGSDETTSEFTITGRTPPTI